MLLLPLYVDVVFLPKRESKIEKKRNTQRQRLGRQIKKGKKGRENER